tara:strand:+ start:244 stop:435 length:192 start_codon:yes stop_codon:yes gene_type:complete
LVLLWLQDGWRKWLVCLCGIGVLATASFTVIPMYLLYKEVIGFDVGADKLKQIGNNESFDATI